MECSWSVITRVITKLDDHEAEVWFVNTSVTTDQIGWRKVWLPRLLLLLLSLFKLHICPKMGKIIPMKLPATAIVKSVNHRGALIRFACVPDKFPWRVRREW